MLARLIGVSVLACSMLSPAAAQGLQPKQCLPMAEMNTALKAEGQRTLIIGDRMHYEGQRIEFAGTTMTRAQWRDLTRDLGADTETRRWLIAKLRSDGKTQAQIDAFIARLGEVTPILEKGDPDAPIPRFMNAFLSNGDGSVGYNLEGDKPAEQKSTRACIVAKFTNIRLARRAVATSGASAQSDLFVGRGVFKNSDGTFREGATGSLRGNIATGEAAFVVLLPNGSAQKLFYMEGVKFTPFGLSVLTD